MESLKFVPFNSTINPGFWHELAKIKLDISGLKEEPIDVCGTFNNSDGANIGLTQRLYLNWDAFSNSPQTNWNWFGVNGKVVIKNTIESFKKEDKMEFIRKEAELIWSKIVDKSWTKEPEILTRFTALMFADLKKYMFYYWFAFPAFNMPAGIKVKTYCNISDHIEPESLEKLATVLKESDHLIYSLTVIESDGSVKRLPMSELDNFSDMSRCLVTVADPSSSQYPGWTVRNLISALCKTHPHLIRGIRILCLRCTINKGQLSVGDSKVITLEVSDNSVEMSDTMPSVVGWEKNDNGQMGPRLANMRSSLDPVKIAENSVDLNLKLMKWRLVPDLQLSTIQNSKCLLLGSGTLGCAVARGLLGWGIRNITMLDNGKVSYSNPVRQSLFTFNDCLNGGKSKALAAAEHLKEIFPGVNAEGVELTIPMPGHNANGALLEKAKSSFVQLEELIADSNVIFLLMDSRESRWLPTALAALNPEKLVVNAALGFDTFLVVRHGVRGVETGEAQLGCYFCNDVVAPGDSTTDRTLDQQCTVTRPGGSGIAASLAVELAVSCLTHPLGAAAPAESSDTILGSVPHTIRGSLHSFNQFTPIGPAFSQCTACSQKILDSLRQDGWEFVRKVMESPRHLEDVTGLTDLMNDDDLMAGVIDIADDDTFSISSGTSNN